MNNASGRNYCCGLAILKMTMMTKIKTMMSSTMKMKTMKMRKNIGSKYGNITRKAHRHSRNGVVE